MVDHGKRSLRRWTQFSLRNLLTLMLVVASFLAGRVSVQRELERVRRAEREAANQCLVERIRLKETMGKLAVATERVKVLWGQLDGAATEIQRLEEELAKQKSTCR